MLTLKRKPEALLKYCFSFDVWPLTSPPGSFGSPDRLSALGPWVVHIITLQADGAAQRHHHPGTSNRAGRAEAERLHGDGSAGRPGGKNTKYVQFSSVSSPSKDGNHHTETGGNDLMIYCLLSFILLLLLLRSPVMPAVPPFSIRPGAPSTAELESSRTLPASLPLTIKRLFAA